MWIRDEKLTKKLLLIALFFLTLFALSLILLFTPVMIIFGALSILAFKRYRGYERGIYLSTYEIELPGLRRERFKAYLLERIAPIDRRTSWGLKYEALFFLKGRESPLVVEFSSHNKRGELLKLLKGYIPTVEISPPEKETPEIIRKLFKLFR